MENAKILIVEDEAIIAMGIENKLQSLGYKVTSVVNTGKKAIKKAETDNPDLILMDIRIKGDMDGIEAAEIIRTRFGIPVIFSTAYLDEERIERAKVTMPFGYLLKPIQERDLKVTLEMALYVAKVDFEHKQAEEKRIESEALLNQMGSIAKIGGWEVDLETMTPHWTEVVREIYDVETIPSVEEAMSFYEPESRSIIQDTFDKLVKEAKPYDLELQLLTSKAKTIFVRTTGKIVYDNSGKPVKAVGILQDISDRKLAEASIRKSEELHRTTIANISDSVFITNDIGEFTYICPNTANNFGYTLEEVQQFGNVSKLLGHHLFDMGKLRALGEITNIEKEIKTKSGKKHALLVNVKSVSINGGTILYTCHNITERIQAEKRIRFQAKILDCIEQAVIATDLKGRITYFNRFAEKLYQWSPEETYKMNIADVTVPQITKLQAEEIMVNLLKGESWQGEFMVQRKDGTAFLADVTDSPILDDHGNLVGIVGISREADH